MFFLSTQKPEAVSKNKTCSRLLTIGVKKGGQRERLCTGGSVVAAPPVEPAGDPGVPLDILIFEDDIDLKITDAISLWK